MAKTQMMAVEVPVPTATNDEDTDAARSDAATEFPLFPDAGSNKVRPEKIAVYRLDPHDGYIGEIPADSSEEDIRRRWGGRTYKLQLKSGTGVLVKNGTRTIVIASPPLDKTGADGRSNEPVPIRELEKIMELQRGQNRENTAWLRDQFSTTAETLHAAHQRAMDEAKQAHEQRMAADRARADEQRATDRERWERTQAEADKRHEREMARLAVEQAASEQRSQQFMTTMATMSQAASTQQTGMMTAMMTTVAQLVNGAGNKQMGPAELVQLMTALKDLTGSDTDPAVDAFKALSGNVDKAIAFLGQTEARKALALREVAKTNPEMAERIALKLLGAEGTAGANGKATNGKQMAAPIPKAGRQEHAPLTAAELKPNGTIAGLPAELAPVVQVLGKNDRGRKLAEMIAVYEAKGLDPDVLIDASLEQAKNYKAGDADAGDVEGEDLEEDDADGTEGSEAGAPAAKPDGGRGGEAHAAPGAVGDGASGVRATRTA